jgi:TRAP-type C4-dicarboxylate transport system permease small subunit
MQAISRLLGGLAALSLLMLLVLTCVDVVGRYVFNKPVLGAMEIEDAMMGVLIFGALPLASWNQAHITVDILDKVTPARWLRLQILLMQLVAAVFMGFLGYRMWIYASKLLEYGDRTMMLKIPLAPVNYFISVMLCFSAALLLLKAYRDAQK